jgi:hypothetical protein
MSPTPLPQIQTPPGSIRFGADASLASNRIGEGSENGDEMGLRRMLLVCCARRRRRGYLSAVASPGRGLSSAARARTRTLPSSSLSPSLPACTRRTHRGGSRASRHSRRTGGDHVLRFTSERLGRGPGPASSGEVVVVSSLSSRC